MPDEKTCFVISPIGDEGSPTRDRSDKILKHIIVPVAEECGYTTIRADRISKPGMITAQIVQQVVEADLLVADLAEWNPNVTYELALRHTLRKPSIHVTEIDEKLPFDVAGSRTIFVNHRDLDSVDAAKSELEKQIRAIEQDPTLVDNPISTAMDLHALGVSENPLHKTNAEILYQLQELRSLVMEMPAQGSAEANLARAASDALGAVNRALTELNYVAMEVGGEPSAIRVHQVEAILNEEALSALTFLNMRLRMHFPGPARGVSTRDLKIAKSFLENDSTSPE